MRKLQYLSACGSILLSLLLVGCSKNDSFQQLLRIWGSKDASAEERKHAALAIVTNGTPKFAVVRLLGPPDGVYHPHGLTVGCYKVIETNGVKVVSEVESGGRFDEECLLYKARDGKVLCLHFDVVGFETNIDQRPFIGISIQQAQAFPFLHQGGASR